MRIYLNNGDNFEITNVNELYFKDLEQYTLNFNIIDNDLNLVTIVNSFNSYGALNSISIKDENNRIIFTSDLYKELISITKSFGNSSIEKPIFSVSISNILITRLDNPTSIVWSNINDTLNELNEILKNK